MNLYNQNFEAFVIYFDTYNDLDIFDQLTDRLFGRSWSPNFLQLQIDMPIYAIFPLNRMFLSEIVVIVPEQLDSYHKQSGKIFFNKILSVEEYSELEQFLIRVIILKIPEARLRYLPKKLIFE